MVNQVNGKFGAIMVAVFAIASPSIASAHVKLDLPVQQEIKVASDHVQLVAYDGSARVTGKLLGYADSVYEMETALGVVRIADRWVRCEGTLCPHTEMDF